MTLWQLELIRRLRARFWMSKSMHTDTSVLSTTEGSFARALIYFQMSVECLWADITKKHAPWMKK